MSVCLDCKWWYGWVDKTDETPPKDPDQFTSDDYTALKTRVDAADGAHLKNGECFLNAPVAGIGRPRTANNTPACGEFEER